MAPTSKVKARTKSDARFKSAVSIAAIPGKVSFLDLPAELRNQVYEELLPTLETKWIYPLGEVRVNSTDKASTAFMATCKQIHEEAASILYAVDSHRVYISSTGAIDFLEKTTAFIDVQNANYAALNQVKVLHLHISANDSRSVCDVQDALFKFLDHLRPNHKLHTLEVGINIDTANDRYGGYEMFNSNYAERMFKQNLMREFADIRPGQLSRAHITAFLTDPLRIVRNLKDGRKKGNFTLDFAGKSGRPWRDILPEIRNLVQSDEPVPNYKVLCKYWEVLRSLQSVAEAAFGKQDVKLLDKALNGLCCARIRGDIKALKQNHDLLDAAMDGRIAAKMGGKPSRSYQDAETLEHELREIAYLTLELASALPAGDADTSFFGYSRSDEALREWQTHGRAAEKQAKAKRKREKDARGEPAKKVKLSGSV
ncbi:hypothetical protein LTR56_002823 [Elasticomyces elasticus]|nr:hypothetical protein LTR56_002823 [Elasticomyces elasticus]KAK3666720.1 hypothetical protein LTR22_002307 [Elasticomyces elasticus]KAK4920438.1 hypothetical protein LTR49_012030 [Elasticomyces elasticus]KAK5759275.1 hypothetical protein LTS12_010598 [Elasticomyces elasticus]